MGYPETRVHVTDQVCAECEHLTGKRDPGLLEQGKGRCTGYEGYTRLANPIVPWNQRACRLFIWAKDPKPRERWMQEQKARQNNNVAQPEMKG